MTYIPHPIADFRQGLFTAKEAFISPADAFSTLKNANIFRGRIKKRNGTDFFAFFPTRLVASSGAPLTLTWADNSDAVEVTVSAVHGLSTGDYVTFNSITGDGSTDLNYKFFFVTVTSTTVFTLDTITWSGLTGTPAPSGGTCEHIKSITKSGTVSGMTNTAAGSTNAVQITTSSAHGLSTGNTVMLVDEEGTAFAGVTALENAISTITVDSTTTFIMDDVFAAGTGTWSAGGAVGLVSTSNNNEIVGMGEFFQNEANNILMVCNARRPAKFDVSNNVLVPLGRIRAMSSGSLADVSDDDAFSSTSTDLFQMTNAFGKIWMTNFKDNVFTYDGTDFTKETFNIDGDGGSSLTFSSHNDLTRCKFIFYYNRRIVLLYTVEVTDGTNPQRVRWSRLDYGAGTTSEWDETANTGASASFLDADTDEEIVSAGFLKDTLIVFFERSIWALHKLPGDDFPFRWEKIAEHPGLFSSRFGVSGHKNILWSMGPGGMFSTDGFQINRLDASIPDFEDEIDDNNWKRVFMAKTISTREVWVSYSSVDNTENDKVKVLDYENGTWAEYDIGYTLMSERSLLNHIAKGWSGFDNELSDTWELTKRTWQEFGALPGAPENIIGKTSGIVHRINEGAVDNGRDIDVVIESIRFNPFKEKGFAARLGWIDFLFDEEASTTLTVEVFNDFDSAPHTTQTLSLAAETQGDGSQRKSVTKVWKRVYVDVTGNSHRFKLSHKSNESFQLHAIVPYFRPEGRLEMI